MNIDIGLAVVILAVLIFYLRLIIIQRERVKVNRQSVSQANKKSKKKPSTPRTSPAVFSILSNNRSDLAIAAVGVLAIVAGVLLNARVFGYPGMQSYWWLPTALGIVAFSWAFKL